MNYTELRDRLALLRAGIADACDLIKQLDKEAWHCFGEVDDLLADLAMTTNTRTSMPSTSPYCLGWRRDYHDTRDILLLADESMLHALPSKVDLSPHCPPVYDQGNLGSCTANAIAAAFEFDVMRQGLPDFMPSRLFIYYYERLLEGDVSEDNGAAIRDGIKVVNKYGVPPESEWPYVISRFADAPSTQAVADAQNDKAVKYRRIPQSLATMKACLASGLPFVFGINVYQSFMDATNGIIPMPAPGETLEGGHALLCVGYDDASRRFIFRNSWGISWGGAHGALPEGYGVIPYAYLASPRLASDSWQIEVVSETVAKLAMRQG